jgi:hypothetical protein
VTSYSIQYDTYNILYMICMYIHTYTAYILYVDMYTLCTYSMNMYIYVCTYYTAYIIYV